MLSYGFRLYTAKTPIGFLPFLSKFVAFPLLPARIDSFSNQSEWVSDLKHSVQRLPSGARSTVISFRANDLKMMPLTLPAGRRAQEWAHHLTHTQQCSSRVWALPKLSEPVADKLGPRHCHIDNETFFSLRSLLIALLQHKHASELLAQVHHDLIEVQQQGGHLAKAEVSLADTLTTTFVGQTGSLRKTGRDYPNHYLLNAHYFASVAAEFDTTHTVLGDVAGLWACDGVLATPLLTPKCTLFSINQGWHMGQLEVDALMVHLLDGVTLTNCPETQFFRHTDTVDGCTPPDPDIHGLVVVGRRVVATRHGGGGRIPMNGLVIVLPRRLSQAKVESFRSLTFVHYELQNITLQQAIQAGTQLVSGGSVCLCDERFIEQAFLSPDGTQTTIPCKFPASTNVTLAARACIGVDQYGDLIGLVVEGIPTQQAPSNTLFENTGLSGGATLEDAAQLMLELGAVDAMNLDGGGSTQLFAGAGALVQPNDTRGVPFASYDRLVLTAILFS